MRREEAEKAACRRNARNHRARFGRDRLLEYREFREDAASLADEILRVAKSDELSENVLELSCCMKRTMRPWESVPMGAAAKVRVTLLHVVLLCRNSFVADTPNT